MTSNKRKVSQSTNIVGHMIKMNQYRSRSDYINDLKLMNVPKLNLKNNPTYQAKLRKSALRDIQSVVN